MIFNKFYYIIVWNFVLLFVFVNYARCIFYLFTNLVYPPTQSTNGKINIIFSIIILILSVFFIFHIFFIKHNLKKILKSKKSNE